MPRIRKKTSRRVAIHKREKLKKNARESRKKKAKEARRNPQWKSKHPKDPGIPNNFPYKDQILAEVAEQRRVAAEEKARRKDEKKAAQAHAVSASTPEGEGGSDAFDGVQALSLDRVRDDDAEKIEADAECDDDGAPVLLNPDLPNLKAVLAAADVVFEVLDARDPLAARSAPLEAVVRALGKRLVLVLNKVDACPREAVEAWVSVLRADGPTVLFRAATACLPGEPVDAVGGAGRGKGKGKEKARVDDAWGLDVVQAALCAWAEEKQGDGPLTVAVVGVTNVGKTSFVNSLLRKTALETYRLTSTLPDSPTTTTHAQEVTVELEGGRQLRVIDTPGLSFLPAEDASPEEATRARAHDILLRNRGHIERLKDPSPALAELVSRATREDLMLLYNLPIFTDGDAHAFLAGVARANGFVKKKGEPDLAGAARMVLRDWSSGKLLRYTLPPSPPPTSTSPSTSGPSSAQDEAVLARLSTRKELRKAGGLVRLRAGAADARPVVLDGPYTLLEDDEGADGDEEDAGTVDDADEVGMDESGSEGEYVSDDEEDDEDEGDDEEDGGEDEEEEEPPRGKRKRALAKAPARPAKRVAFAPEPKGTKRARSAAGAKGQAKGAERERKAATKKTAVASASAKKVANAAAKAKKAAVKEGEVAYDFKQFF